jgi:hypothetical protein
MAATPSGNVYAAVRGGDIYMQTNGTGDFVALGQTTRDWFAMAAAPNGNVYAAVFSGDIYMQTNGTGDFVALGQTSRQWIYMTAAPNGNVYAAVYLGDIYMQTNGIGNFVALGQTSRPWFAMAAAPNGNVYAAAVDGDIYMQTNGFVNFVALEQTSRSWVSMAAAPNGNVYAATGSDIYMQTNGIGNFVALGQTFRNWRGMAAAPNENVYAAVSSGDIYMQNTTSGTTNLNGGTLTLASGAGKGLGTSTINFQTSTTLLNSSRTLQTLSTKMTILGNGNVGIGTTTPSAILHSVGSITASGLMARGNYMQPTLVASANNDVLVALDIAPTFTNGLFNNVQNFAIRSGGNIAFTNGGNRSLTVQQSNNVLEGRSLTINAGSTNNSGGTGNFDPLLQTSRSWSLLGAAPNGNVYAAVFNGDIYMQTNGILMLLEEC